jgi:hypothetical protein
MSIFSTKLANIGAKKPFDIRENNTKILKIEYVIDTFWVLIATIFTEYERVLIKFIMIKKNIIT